jgi:uncharacterized protein
MQHRTFKILVDNRYIIYIPSLKKIFEVDSSVYSSVPEFFESEQTLNTGTWDDMPDICFGATKLILTENCNLACSYCYESGCPKKDSTLNMTEDIAFAAIDHVANCIKDSSHSKFFVSFFGGEPTQAFEILVSATEYSRKIASNIKKESVTGIVTNGAMEIDQAIWLSQNIDHITISVDGPKQIHDAQRSNSFDKVFSNSLEIFKRAPGKIAFRVTVTKSSVNQVTEIVTFFGKNFPGTTIILEPAFELGRGKKSKFGMPDHDDFFEAFLDALTITKKYGLTLRTAILSLGAQGHQFCGVSGSNFMIAPDGQVTSCNRMIFGKDANSAFSFGHYDSTIRKFIFDEDNYNWLKRLTVSSIPACQDCFAQTNCRGECPANKASIDPEDFWCKPSYRCAEIKRFIAKILLYVLDNGESELKEK